MILNIETNIPLAVKRGLLTVQDVDRALTRVLRVGFRLGAFDPAGSSPYDKLSMSVVRSPEHLDLALRTAKESMTLLSNRNSFLPLQRKAIRSVAVIGPAGDGDYETGNYYGTPARKVGVTAALRDFLGSDAEVKYEKGAGFVDLPDTDGIERAVALARKSDVVVLCLGNKSARRS